MSGLEERIAEVLREHHLWDSFDDKARCRCDVDHPSITNGVPDGGWMTFDEHLAHVAAVLVAELGLTREVAVDFRGDRRIITRRTDLEDSVRAVTGWAAE